MKLYTYDKTYDIIVIGAGHAGCEATLAASRMGMSTLLLTINLDTIAQMSCNPAIGGLAKGHIVREIDALGGEMAKITDASSLQFRMLNTKKGPAVWAPRAQCDKKLYQLAMKKLLESQPNLEVKQQLVDEILVEKGKINGVLTQTGLQFKAKAVIVTTGTFLKGLIHIGEVNFPAGRMGDAPAMKLSHSLRQLGFEIGRLKTGTPCRINRRSVDFSKVEIQPGDEPPQPFSYSNNKILQRQIPCYITYTNPKTHEYIRHNLERSPLYSGRIKGVGPRYCPSIEDKVVRFPHKVRHQIFLEPEGLNTEEIYLNGLSTSLPQDVQIQMLRTIKGLEKAEIMRFGYAIEYDFAPPTQIKANLETKVVENLFFAGQINGTSGYEEAAGQGLMAGINAVLKLKGKPPFVLRRDEAYIGVLIDDLITKGTSEPYRMFTSRAEYRLILRQDNADLRLMEYGYKLGLISKKQYATAREKKRKISEGINYLKKTKKGNISLAKVLSRPGINFSDLKSIGSNGWVTTPHDVLQQIEIEIKYAGYIKRALAQVSRFKKLEDRRIPDDLNYDLIKGLRRESQEKLNNIHPASIGQASRISGISPSDISVLLVYLEQKYRREKAKQLSAISTQHSADD